VIRLGLGAQVRRIHSSEQIELQESSLIWAAGHYSSLRPSSRFTFARANGLRLCLPMASHPSICAPRPPSLPSPLLHIDKHGELRVPQTIEMQTFAMFFEVGEGRAMQMLRTGPCEQVGRYGWSLARYAGSARLINQGLPSRGKQWLLIVPSHEIMVL